MLIGCIDIGTNSVRWLAATVSDDNQVAIRDRGLTVPRLGKGLNRSGTLTEEAIERTGADLGRIKKRLDSLGVGRYRCVGTEALRKAENADIFLNKIREEIGLTVTVLSGEEEARLIRDGAGSDFHLPAKKTVWADIGGGSTEVIRAGKKGSTDYASLPLGCVRLGEEFLPDEEDTPLPENKIKKYCRKILEDRLDPPEPDTGLIGLGGTFTTLAAIKLELEPYRGDIIHGTVLSAREIEAIFRRLAEMAVPQREKIPGLPPDRADIILPGIIIGQTLLKFFRTDRITVSDRGLLYGLLFSPYFFDEKIRGK